MYPILFLIRFFWIRNNLEIVFSFNVGVFLNFDGKFKFKVKL